MLSDFWSVLRREFSVISIPDRGSYSYASHYVALDFGNHEIIDTLPKFGVNTEIVGAEEVLAAAAHRGHVVLVQELLAARVDVNTRRFWPGQAPSDAICCRGTNVVRTHIVQTLIGAGTDVSLDMYL
jgi:hypothetical protein